MITEFLPIGISKSEKIYYLWNPESELTCSKCQKLIHKKFLLNTFSHKLIKDYVQKIYCLNCFKTIKLQSNINESYVFVKIGEKPSDLIPVYPSVLVPEMGDFAHSVGGQTLSDEDLKKEDMTKLHMENCKFAFNPLQSMMEGAEPEKIHAKVMKQIEKQDKPLDIDDGLKALEGLASAKPYSWAEQDKEEEAVEEARRLDESKNGRRLIT